jgi:hypothetical protein
MSLKLTIGILTMTMAAIMAVPGAAVAQDNENTDHATQNVTGCLQKSAAPNLYMLIDENGKTWNLRSQTVPLDQHVGHTVNVKGTIPEESKGSSDTTPQNNLTVTKLDMVRASCKQP